MIDRWRERDEPRPGQGALYWHILLGDVPGARDIARSTQARIAGFSGLHLTPANRLHITMLELGESSEVNEDQRQRMLAIASAALAELPPVIVELSRIIYHPEAIALVVQPAENLDLIRTEIFAASRKVTGRESMVHASTRWLPHMTLAYSELEQAAEPIIATLGLKVPSCSINVSAVSLVEQVGAERLWDWHTIGTVHLLGSPPGASEHGKRAPNEGPSTHDHDEG